MSGALLKNPTLQPSKLLIFLNQLITRGVDMSMQTKINDEGAKRDYGAGVVSHVAKSKAQLKVESHGMQMRWNSAISSTEASRRDKKT